MLGGRKLAPREGSPRASIGDDGLVFSEGKRIVPANHLFAADERAVLLQRDFLFAVGKEFAGDDAFQYRVRFCARRHLGLNPILERVEKFLAGLLALEPFRRIAPGLKNSEGAQGVLHDTDAGGIAVNFIHPIVRHVPIVRHFVVVEHHVRGDVRQPPAYFGDTLRQDGELEEGLDQLDVAVGDSFDRFRFGGFPLFGSIAHGKVKPRSVFLKVCVVQVLEKIVPENGLGRPHRFVSLLAVGALLLCGSVENGFQRSKLLRKFGLAKNARPDLVRPDEQVAGKKLAQAEDMIAGFCREFHAFVQEIERLEFVHTVFESQAQLAAPNRAQAGIKLARILEPPGRRDGLSVGKVDQQEVVPNG